MAERLIRVDRGVALLEVYDKDAPLPTPGHAPATYHRDGYLIAEALIARDGLLQYSDGTETWLEYRPREELVTAAASWAGTPITDEHPAKMVKAETWTEVAKGIHISAPEVIDVDGVAYLRADIMITSADLLKKIEKLRADGIPAELSIGFTTLVKPERGKFHGREYIAIQTVLLGNHTAVVKKGRAGPSCRILFDGAAVSIGDINMSEVNTTKKPKQDDEGAPADTVEITGPNGPAMVPTWVAAELEALQGMRAQQQAPAAAPPAPAAPAPPVAPAAPADATPPQPPAPRDPSASPPPNPEEEEDKKMDAKQRRQYERHAEKLGADDDKLDSMDDDALRRFIVAGSTSLSLEALEQVKGDSLDALTQDAIKKAKTSDKGDGEEPNTAPPKKQPEPRAPWGGQARGDGKPTPGPTPAVATFLQDQGYDVV